MSHEIISFLTWSIVFGYVIFKAESDLGKIGGKIYKIHILLAWILLIQHFTAFQMLGWAVGHPKDIFEYFLIPVGPFPAWFNLSTWAGNLIFSIVAIILSFSLAKRKEKARLWLLRLIPAMYLFGVTEALKGFYKGESECYAPLLVAIFINASLVAIPFIAIFLFYRKESVKKQIFITHNQVVTKAST
jgi:hypothetical protein